MYKPLQKKSSSWTGASIQKKSKSFSKPGSSAVQASRDANSAESQDMPSYSTASADLLAANIMRGMETQEQEQVEISTVQRQSDSGRAAVAAVAPPIVSIPVVQPNAVGIQRQCSECASQQLEQSEEEGKDVDEISGAASGIQTKLTVGAPGDVYEQEADRVAAQVMSMPVAAAAGPQVQRFGEEPSPVGMYSSLVQSITPVVQRRVDQQVQMYSLVQRGFQAGGTQVSGDLESRLNASSGGGSALAPEVRAFMEPRFGADFSSVRVHTGSEAVQMNRELGAQAFTHGSDVYFGGGKEPGNNELTAHELTHVIQQGAISSSTHAIQRTPGDGDKKVPYPIKVPPDIKTEEELDRYAEVLIFGKVMNIRWKVMGWDVAAFAKQGKTVRYVYDASFVSEHGGKKEGEATKPKSYSSAYNVITGEQRKALNEEIDKRYWQGADISPGEKIKPGEKSKADMWNVYRDQVLFQREYINNLPPEVKKLINISTNGKIIAPNDYEQLYRIAKNIEGMDTSEVLDYYSKISGSTTDLNTFEASLDAYIKQQEERKKETEKREALQTKLYGLEDVYKAYKAWKTLKGISIPSQDEFGVHDPNADLLRKSTEDAERNLVALLQKHGFAGIAEFERYISDFEVAFQKEAVNIALDILSKYEGLLYQEGERYKEPKVIESLHKQLGGFRSQYQIFKQNADISNNYAENSERSRLPGNGNLRPTTTKQEADQAYEKARVAKEGAISQVKGLSGEHPLLKEDHLPLDRRLDKEKMAQADPSGLGKLIQEHIAARIKDIHEAKAHILDDPAMVFKLDKLRPEFYARMGITKGSTTDQIVQDKISAIQSKETIINIVLAVFAIALAIVSFGTATPFIATAAAVGGFGISAYMAFDEYQKYIVQNDLADVGFADDPSMFWLIVAVAGAVLDMGAAVKAVKALAPAAKALNAGGTVTEFSKALKLLQESGEIDAKIAAAAERAALAKQSFKEASGDLVNVLSSRAYSFPGPFADPDVYRELVRMAAAKIREGAAAFEQFVLELQKARKFAKLGDMTPEELAKAKEAWEQANKLAKSATEPVDILNPKSGKVFGRYSSGNFMEVQSKSTNLYGGNTIKLHPEKTTTLTGTLDDVNAVADRGFNLPGATVQGPNPGGINILRSPKWQEILNKHKAIFDAGDTSRYWKTVTDEFWETVNKPWLDDAIARGDNFRFVSNPSDDFAIFVTNKKGTEFILDSSGKKIKSIFAGEVEYLKSKGYTFQPDGSAVKAP
jgi:hypothetical protein